MVTPEKMLDLITFEPFEPFRISTSDGRMFEIWYPEWIRVGRTSVSVYVADPNDPTAHQWEDYSVDSIDSIGPLYLTERKY